MTAQDEKNWLDEAFDEGKANEDIEHAKNARRFAYLALAIVVSVFAICGASFCGLPTAYQKTSGISRLTS